MVEAGSYIVLREISLLCTKSSNQDIVLALYPQIKKSLSLSFLLCDFAQCFDSGQGDSDSDSDIPQKIAIYCKLIRGTKIGLCTITNESNSVAVDSLAQIH